MKKNKTFFKSSTKTLSSSSAAAAATPSSSSFTSNNDQLNEYEIKYRKLRNERNKLLRKKKGIEINLKRQQMSNELKSIRKTMKKLRRKHHSNKIKFVSPSKLSKKQKY